MGGVGELRICVSCESVAQPPHQKRNNLEGEEVGEDAAVGLE